MRKIRFVFLIVFSAGIATLSTHPAMGVGFSAGNEFQATLIEGDLTIFCPGVNGEMQSSFFGCRAGILEPVAYDYFVGPVSEGNSVILNVTR